MIHYIKNDGGRKASGFEGKAGDCAARAIAIVTEQPYHRVYAQLAWINFIMPKTRGRTSAGIHSASNGIHINSILFKRYMIDQNLIWTPVMNIGTGCRIHLKDNELPMGRLVVRVSKHLTAVINGVIHDTHDPSRNGTRCVYGFWKLEKQNAST